MDLLYPQHISHVIQGDPAKHALFNSLWSEYFASEKTTSDPTRVLQFMYLVEIANGLAGGDYIELGTHKGFTLKIIHKLMDPARTLYGLDTFEGFDARDISVEHKLYDNSWTVGNFSPTSVEAVGAYVGDGQQPNNLRLVKGWFPDSFRGLESHSWRFVHIDLDLYQPMKHALDLLWDKLVPGGVMLVHDYGCLGFAGARKAVDDFCAITGILPVQLSDRWGSAVIRKPFRPVPRSYIVTRDAAKRLLGKPYRFARRVASKAIRLIR